MSKAGTYLLVEPPFTLESFRGVAQSMLLKPSGSGKGTEGVDYSESWSDGKTTVEWLEVGKLGCSFVWFVSPDPGRTVDYLKDKLDAKELAELVSNASEADLDHDELVDLLYRVGYMAREASDEVLALFERTMKDSRPTIRRAALNGYMIRRWPRLRGLVDEISTNDSDSEVRATAKKALDLPTPD